MRKTHKEVPNMRIANVKQEVSKSTFLFHDTYYK